MTKLLNARTGVIVAVCALVGLLVGVGVAMLLTAQPQRYKAEASVAMLPGSELAPADAANFWEVLSRGQVTRTGAVIYDDTRWLPEAAATAGVPADDLTLTAGAVPDTSLLLVTMEAGSADAAEAALTSVMDQAGPEATRLSAPFVVQVVTPAAGSATAEGPAAAPTVAACGIGGLLVGAGVGALGVRVAGRRRTSAQHAADAADAAASAHAVPFSPTAATRNGAPVSAGRGTSAHGSE